MDAITLALLFTSASQSLNLPANLLSAVCFVESAHRVSVITKDDGGSSSIGICQVQPRTARYMGYKGPDSSLLNPKINIHIAAKYLRYQYARYGSWDKAVIAYNRGNAKGLNDSRYLQKVKKAKRLHGH